MSAKISNIQRHLNSKGRRQKKLGKSGQAERLGRPLLPRSGQENVKNSRQVVIFGVILPIYKGQMGQNFHKLEAVSLTAFSEFFF